MLGRFDPFFVTFSPSSFNKPPPLFCSNLELRFVAGTRFFFPIAVLQSGDDCAAGVGTGFPAGTVCGFKTPRLLIDFLSSGFYDDH